MSRKTQAAVGVILAAIAIVALMAAPAFADVAVSLGIAPTTARYGTELVITPSVTGTQTIPGDGITLEAFYTDGTGWTSYGEGLKVEDTDTVDPQFIIADESFLPWYSGAWAPIQFRAVFHPVSRGVDASGVALPAPPAVTSNVASLNIVRFTSTRIKSLMTAKSVKHGKAFTVSAQVSPDCGVGHVRIKITRKGAKKPLYNVVTSTDDTGFASLRAKIARSGSYSVEMTFLGNAFGKASKTVKSTLKVK